ncbi:MAG: threonine-phosphate decarboxylase [Succiniclasticum sp.]|jgi:threonine-phosphate decarboxylase|nr:threonine-phosphate decarboxylase [Succiniclasticum sp.]MEE3478579.1 threonine-phosphate decarboxylase [Succiniclasticum sp.]
MYQYVHGGDIYGADGLPQKKVLLDFSANINPLGIPSGVRQAIRDAIAGCVNYPDPFCRRLRARLAERLGVPAERIYCGNGASDVLFRLAFSIRPKRTLVLAPTFADYERAATAAGSKMDYFVLRKEDGFRVTPDLVQAITKRTGMVILCNPNNPTGQLTEKSLLQKVLQKCADLDIPLIIDECFLDFLADPAAWSLLDLTGRYPNLVILKAFTKSHAIPGVRLGYCVTGNADLLDRLYACGPDWNVSGLAQAAGVAALEDESYMEATRQLMAREREYMTTQLRRLGLTVYDGAADYLFFYAPQDPGWGALLRERGILIRDCSNYHGLGKGYYRVAVKQRRQNRQLIKEMKEIKKHAFITDLD